jgi:hypothetical protein
MIRVLSAETVFPVGEVLWLWNWSTALRDVHSFRVCITGFLAFVHLLQTEQQITGSEFPSPGEGVQSMDRNSNTTVTKVTVNINTGRAISHSVSRWLPTATARVQTRV